MQDGERQHRIEEVVQPVLRDHGLTLVDLEWRAHRPRGVLRLFVDKPGGVGIDDCQRASREIGDLIDAADLIDGGYDLEVSSPGLDRLLCTDREFQWALGKAVACWVSGGEKFTGRLVDARPDALVLDDGGRRVELTRASVTKARLEPALQWPRRAAGT